VSRYGDLIVGAPVGVYTQLRPYVSAGVGLLRSRIGGGANDIILGVFKWR
jgi:hypothetical protein